MCLYAATDQSSEEGIGVPRTRRVLPHERAEGRRVPQSSLATTRVISFQGDQAVHLTSTTDSDTGPQAQVRETEMGGVIG